MKFFRFLVPGSWFLVAVSLGCERKTSIPSAPITCSPGYAASALPEDPPVSQAGDCRALFDPVVIGTPKEDARVRVFALAHRIDVQEGESESAYLQTMDCMMASASTYFSKNIPNLVVFEEYAGLPLVFHGDAGDVARKQSTLLGAALLFTKLTEPRAVIHRMASHAWKPFIRTFSHLARKYDVPIMTTTLVPAFDPQTLDVSESDLSVTNTTLLFDTQGRIVYRWDKVNLVPSEQGFEITSGALESVGSCDYAGYRFGIGISLDAFIPSYLSHLNDLGVQVLVQPDANDSSWASAGGAGYWQPEEWLGSVFFSLQDEYPNILYNVNPMMTGRFFDETFDGQTAITAKNDPRIRRDVNYVGNRPLDLYPLGPRPGQPNMGPFPLGGFVVLGPWFIEDPAFPVTCEAGISPCLGLDRVARDPSRFSELSRAERADDHLSAYQDTLISLADERDSIPPSFLESLVFADL